MTADPNRREDAPPHATRQEAQQLLHLLTIGATEDAELFRALLAVRSRDGVRAAPKQRGVPGASVASSGDAA